MIQLYYPPGDADIVKGLRTMAGPDAFEIEGTPEEIYEQYLVPAIFDYWSPKLVESVSIQSGQCVLDLACGTGTVTRYAAQAVAPDGDVVGLDVNPSMLEVAHSACSEYEDMIDFKEGTAEDLEFSSDRFDVVTCQQSLQFFEDRDRALEEAHRVLEPGGRLGLSVWREIERSPGYEALRDTLEKYGGAKAAAFIESPFTLSDPDELSEIVERADFRTVQVEDEVGPVQFPSLKLFVEEECRAAASYFSEDVFELSPELLDSITSELAQRLQQYRTNQGLEFPIETHVLIAQK